METLPRNSHLVRAVVLPVLLLIATGAAGAWLVVLLSWAVAWWLS